MKNIRINVQGTGHRYWINFHDYVRECSIKGILRVEFLEKELKKYNGRLEIDHQVVDDSTEFFSSFPPIYLIFDNEEDFVYFKLKWS